MKYVLETNEVIYNKLMDKFLHTKTKKIIFFIIIIGAIEVSGHGIFASLFRFLNSLN